MQISGADGSAPALVSVTIALTDWVWDQQGRAFVAGFSAVKDFSYTGPKQHISANGSGVSLVGTRFTTSSASVADITTFDISYGEGAGFFVGDDTGWGLG